MNDQRDFDRIASAIEYISRNFKSQPSLASIAGHVNLSPYHFQRLFTQWAGVSPKKFLRYTSSEYAKELIRERPSLAELAHQVGLSGTGRLHDLFISLEGMTPGEYKNGGANLSIRYDFLHSPFGEALVASTDKGVCFLAFVDDREVSLQELISLFPSACFSRGSGTCHRSVQGVLNGTFEELDKIALHIRATPFQYKIWQALLKIPSGHLATYSGVASIAGSPKASRAAGSAIGSNPVAYLIPCHRVIRASGIIGDYRWGPTRKKAMIGWEAAHVSSDVLSGDLDSQK